MKKKIWLLPLLIIILAGCTNLKDLSYDDILNNVIVKSKNINTYRNGYNLYIPKGIKITKAKDSYVILSSSNANYYLYVDLISYASKKDFNYNIKNDIYYSNTINYNGLKGYVEINLWENNQYLIEIMYNYAKIEVMVDSSELKEALVNATLILANIHYDDIIINNLINDDNLNYTEEIFDIFKNSENVSSDND